MANSLGTRQARYLPMGVMVGTYMNCSAGPAKPDGAATRGSLGEELTFADFLFRPEADG